MLSAPITMGLDDCLEYCGQDELVEVFARLLPYKDYLQGCFSRALADQGCSLYALGTGTKTKRGGAWCIRCCLALLRLLVPVNDYFCFHMQVTPTNVRLRKNPNMAKKGGR